MNTPLTDNLIKKARDETTSASAFIGRVATSLDTHARDLERKVQQLKSAIEIAEQHIAYGRNESAQATLLDALVKLK